MGGQHLWAFAPLAVRPTIALIIVQFVTDVQGGLAKVRPTYIFDGNI